MDAMESQLKKMHLDTVLSDIADVMEIRRNAAPGSSYVSQLLHEGEDKILKKVIEVIEKIEREVEAKRKVKISHEAQQSVEFGAQVRGDGCGGHGVSLVANTLILRISGRGYELHESAEQPGLWRAHSGRLAACAVCCGCSS